MTFQCWSKDVHTEEVKIRLLLWEQSCSILPKPLPDEKEFFPQLKPVSDFEVNTSLCYVLKMKLFIIKLLSFTTSGSK